MLWTTGRFSNDYSRFELNSAFKVCSGESDTKSYQARSILRFETAFCVEVIPRLSGSNAIVTRSKQSGHGLFKSQVQHVSGSWVILRFETVSFVWMLLRSCQDQTLSKAFTKQSVYGLFRGVRYEGAYQARV